MTGSVRAEGRRLGSGAAVHWQVPEEVPVAFSYNGRRHAVMLATPADLEDFAVGFSLTEGIVADATAIAGITVSRGAGGVALDLQVPPALLQCEKLGGRAIEGRSGCGLCGVHDLGDVLSPRRPRPPPSLPTAPALARAFAALPAAQPMKLLNRSVHGAVLCGADGAVLCLREDLGRHNALDKLAGALARGGIAAAGGFVLVTSRVSVEIVHKTLALDAETLVGVSAPSSLALDVARQAGLHLIGCDGDGGFVVF